MATVFVGLGGNVGCVGENLRTALFRISRFPDTRIARVSSLYLSAPVGMTNQPDFVNGVAQIETQLDPTRFLGLLLEVEASLGRTREISGGPRTVDLDVLLWDDRVADSAGLTIPHPRMHQRGFVLVPFAEIAPEIRHPRIGKTIRELLRDLGPTPDVMPLRRSSQGETQEQQPLW